MKRRQAITLTAGSILTLSGCSSASGFLGGSSPVEVVSKDATVENARCDTPDGREHSATVTFVENDHLELSGEIEADRPCDRLFIHSDTGIGQQDVSDDAIILDIDPAFHGDCEPCPAELSYTGSVTFDRRPSAVYLYHVEKEGTQWKRVGPVASTGDA